MFLHYFKIAFRGLAKYKWQNIVCILGLTIGFSAFILGGYWWYWENHFDDFHPDAQYTYAITTIGISRVADDLATEGILLPKDDANWFLQNIPEIEKHCYTKWNLLRYTKDGKDEYITGLSVEPTFFTMFRSEFIDGGYESIPLDGRHIVLTELAAKKYFGKINCVGETLPDKTTPHKVVGVIKNYPSNTNFRFEFLSLHNSLSHAEYPVLYIQFNEHTVIKNIRRKTEDHQSIVSEDRFHKPRDWSFRLRTLAGIHVHCHPELESRFQNIQLLSLAGLFALISSLMNHLVLFTGQQQKRQKRNATFKSMGASTSYLFMKNLIDLLIPIILALTSSLILVRILFPYYQSYTQWQGYGIFRDFVNQLNFNDMMRGSFGWLVVITGVFLSVGSSIIVVMLKRMWTQSPFILRWSLIFCQILIGSIFLFVSLALFQQFHFVQHKDKGITVENITQIDVGMYKLFDKSVRDELLRSPYIEDVTFTTTPILTDVGEHYLSHISRVTINGQELNEVKVMMVESNFLDFFGMKIKEGEWISGEEVVINETQAQMFGDVKLVGQPIKMPGLEGKISGVMHNYNYSTMQYPVAGLFFRLDKKDMFTQYQYAYIKTKPENHTKALDHAQKIIETVNTGELPDGKRFRALTDIMDEFNRPERTLSLIFGILSLACILVVSFGIYSLITLTIEQRRKEIAIRKVNGAEFVDMLQLFFREYFVLVIIGNVFALTVGYYLMLRWFETYTYHTTLSWWLFAVVLVITCIIVFLSVISKISEAAKVDPAEALKYE